MGPAAHDADADAAPAPAPPPSPRARVAAAWRHVRAVLVTLHVAAIVVAAVPGPDGGMSRGVWRDPAVRAELEAWSARLGTTPDRLEAWVFPLAMRLFEARGAALRLVGPYVDWTGTEQPWRLFVAPDRVPSRFELAAHREGAADWDVLFEERSTQARWNAGYFEHPRVRRALYWYGWPPMSGDAGTHCRWLARRVFRERRDVDVVRCRFYRAPSPSASQVRAGVEPPGRWGQQTLVARREVARDD